MADDVILLAPTLAKLHAELDLTCSFANRECFTIHPTKSSVITRGLPAPEVDFLKDTRPWNLNNEALTVGEDFIHLGVH